MTSTTEPKNDWRMQLTARVAKDWTSPWTGQTAPKGSQLTLSSIIVFSKKKRLTIAVPNATALCLSASARSWREAVAIRRTAKIDSSLKSEVTFQSHTESFDYIERVIESVILAYTGLEAFANEVIPDKYEYHAHRRSEIILEVMTKPGIERWMSLDEKLASILPDVLKVKSPKGHFFLLG